MKTFDYLMGLFLVIGGFWLIWYFKTACLWFIIGIIVTAMGLLELYITYKSD